MWAPSEDLVLDQLAIWRDRCYSVEESETNSDRKHPDTSDRNNITGQSRFDGIYSGSESSMFPYDPLSLPTKMKSDWASSESSEHHFMPSSALFLSTIANTIQKETTSRNHSDKKEEEDFRRALREEGILYLDPNMTPDNMKRRRLKRMKTAPDLRKFTKEFLESKRGNEHTNETGNACPPNTMPPKRRNRQSESGTLATPLVAYQKELQYKKRETSELHLPNSVLMEMRHGENVSQEEFISQRNLDAMSPIKSSVEETRIDLSKNLLKGDDSESSDSESVDSAEMYEKIWPEKKEKQLSGLTQAIKEEKRKESEVSDLISGAAVKSQQAFGRRLERSRSQANLGNQSPLSRMSRHASSAQLVKQQNLYVYFHDNVSDRVFGPVKISVYETASVAQTVSIFLRTWESEDRDTTLLDNLSTDQLTLRVAEDDGRPDTDLPPLDRTARIGEFIDISTQLVVSIKSQQTPTLRRRRMLSGKLNLSLSRPRSFSNTIVSPVIARIKDRIIRSNSKDSVRPMDNGKLGLQTPESRPVPDVYSDDAYIRRVKRGFTANITSDNSAQKPLKSALKPSMSNENFAALPKNVTPQKIEDEKSALQRLRSSSMSLLSRFRTDKPIRVNSTESDDKKVVESQPPQLTKANTDSNIRYPRSILTQSSVDSTNSPPSSANGVSDRGRMGGFKQKVSKWMATLGDKSSRRPRSESFMGVRNRDDTGIVPRRSLVSRDLDLIRESDGRSTPASVRFSENIKVSQMKPVAIRSKSEGIFPSHKDV